MILYQQYAKNYLSNIYQVDVNSNILPIYLYGKSKEELLYNFTAYRNAIINIFQRISETENGLYVSRDETDRDTIIIPIYCLFAILYTIGSIGIFENGCLLVNKKVFKERFRKVKNTLINNAVSLLQDGGFIFNGNIWGKGDGFAVDYPDNSHVLYGLQQISSTIDWDINSTAYPYGKAVRSFILLNNRLFGWERDAEKPFQLYDIFRFMNNTTDMNAIQLFHENMVEHGYLYEMHEQMFFGCGADIRYDFKPYDPRATVYFFPEENKACVGLKMRTLAFQTEYIQQCSVAFKQGFDKLWSECKLESCPYTINDINNCECRVRYNSSNESFDKCTNTGWEYIWDKAVFQINQDDINTYMHFIELKYKKSVRK